MLRGYRLVVIGINDMNKDRRRDKLRELINKKLNIMKQYKAYLV
jgi:hypothetical protein